MSKYLFFIACVMLIFSCSEENNRAPVTDDSTIPGQVSNVQAESLPGAVKLTYVMPSGQSLAHVRAECLINGVMRKVKASSYINNLTIEGFADESEYTVNLYSVNRSELESEPVMVTVKPLSPPFRDTFKDIQLIDDWGGATAIFTNPYEADLALNIIYQDSNGFWNHGDTYYTKSKEGTFSLRGFEPVKTTFGVYVRDRWDNISDTLVKELVPRFEKQLDRLKFQMVFLPGDHISSVGGISQYYYMWDGDLAKNTTGTPTFVTSNDGTWPQWIHVDLGVTEGALLSRFRYWQRGKSTASYQYGDRNIKKFEIWGSMNPNPDGSWESWTLLLDGEVIKPSGLPQGQVSEEDVQAIYDGHEFTFPIEIPHVRYIRLLCKETWANQRTFQVDQIAFWGMEPSDIQ